MGGEKPTKGRKCSRNHEMVMMPGNLSVNHGRTNDQTSLNDKNNGEREPKPRMVAQTAMAAQLPGWLGMMKKKKI
jgi:hypothetical protein